MSVFIPGFRAAGADENFRADARESYNVGWDTTNHPDPPYGPTPWPSEDLCPGFRAASERYAELLLSRSRWLRKLLGAALSAAEARREDGCDEDENTPSDEKHAHRTAEEAPSGPSNDRFFDRAPWLLGFVRYAPVVSDVDQNLFGIAPHQDDGVFTLLHTDGSPGLQVCPAWRGADVHRDEAMFGKDLGGSFFKGNRPTRPPPVTSSARDNYVTYFSSARDNY